MTFPGPDKEFPLLMSYTNSSAVTAKAKAMWVKGNVNFGIKSENTF